MNKFGKTVILTLSALGSEGMFRKILLLTFLLVSWQSNSAGAVGNIHSIPVDIMIDVGHGGIDGGTLHGNLLEKDINLEIAKELYRQLANYGYHVVLNRTGDYALSDENKWLKNPSRHKRDLAQRKHLAVELPPQILISLHVNWSRDSSERGADILYQKNNQSYMLADILQYRLNEFYNIKDRPPKGAKYYLLKQSVCPTVIVEMGYISNAQDRVLLTNHTGQKQLASAICTGVNEYFQLVGRINSPPINESWIEIWKRWWRRH
ncbi:N-acetylmuramoyl-L-alanine amidase [Aneurinibacillus sp. Ricciae_BoGa-3]|uniref:N-acetylmuramoyl-L-alanine amidase family protein n=1 Tax=Aneurinibacillus sp. Ricciae_BoGa-3 TaxID=3022697 RepID=UPI00234060A0|nr:N-acetylmuramoyl-L-alanine amidase [Aneurinibacillus sp. Ricciae_BoGa-3]WCK55423.1 N-acetylmuramoyl-L-alanine amidase [Aneurinibacillus sp. Ricciae_BoGa-3]